MIQDGLPNTGLSNWELSRRRLFAYAEKLKEDGFPFDFCPILVSGLCTDNSPPGPGVIEFVHRWNEENGTQITLEMTTLDRFFEEVEKHADGLPVYRGDWTDWWADGTCSTPDAVSHYREAGATASPAQDPRTIKPSVVSKVVETRMLDTWGLSFSSLKSKKQGHWECRQKKKTMFL